LLLAAVVTACAPSQPEPRSVLDFMDDGLAREGVLTRCNQNRDATLDDPECVNARRAAATLAIEGDRERAEENERESERKLLALRERSYRESAAERGPTSAADASSAAPSFGAPVGAVMPSMTESSLFDVYADGSDPLGRPNLEVAAAEPPANDFEIASPELELADLAIIPRPFRSEDGTPVPQ
jgi:hypothetical protein